MNFIRLINFPRNRGKRALYGFLCGAILLLLGALTAEPASPGILEVRVKDHREAIGDFSKLEIEIDTIRISPKIGLKFWQMGWKELKPTVSKIDLTKYTGGQTATVFRGEVVPGAFEAVHLKLKGIEGILKNGKGEAPVKNSVGPIKLAFSVGPKNDILIVLDFMVVDVSDHPPSGYELHLKGYEVYDDGKLVDKIPPG
jgi:hypothetical protein